MSEENDSFPGNLPNSHARYRPVWLDGVEAPLRRMTGTKPFRKFVASIAADSDSLEIRLLRTIQVAVVDYPSLSEVERRERFNDGIRRASHQFIEILFGIIELDPGVSDLFRRIGVSEAADGHDLEVSRHALFTGTLWTWRLFHHRMPEDLGVAHLGALGDSLIAYATHLDTEISAGYSQALSDLQMQPRTLKRELISALLDESASDREERRAELALLAVSVGWPLPNRMVAIRADGIETLPDLSSTPAVVADEDASPMLVVCHAALSESIVRLLTSTNAGAVVAVTWAVAPEEVADADRWARRTLSLAARGVLPTQRILRCREHRLELWMHAEPKLRQYLTLELLAPLLSERSSTRTVLAEAMLACLDTRDSAPVIGLRLGVHPQTIRYRWKRINDLFGEVLHDPTLITAISLTLRATLPLWQAGDSSDFDAYREHCQGD